MWSFSYKEVISGNLIHCDLIHCDARNLGEKLASETYFLEYRTF